MAIISINFTFSAGAVIIASQHNANFSTIYTDYNGNITNDNISASAVIAYSKLTLTGSIVNADINTSAAIVYSKLNLTGNIVNADINASAAIVDTKLAQITTASKVSGTSITGLASLPSGAGIIPAANLPSTSGLLGTWASATLASSTQVTTDGFLVGFAASGGAGQAATIKTDSANPPTVVRASFMGGTGITGCLITPIKKNDYYLTAATATLTLYFIPLGS